MNTSRHTIFRMGMVVASILVAIGCDNGPAIRSRVEMAEAQVRRIAADLDSRTTESGAYIRVKEGELREIDPWGNRVQVIYSQGGVAEMVTVRSAGPDREFHTSDDVVAQGMAANMKGIGEGIKKNAEETAAKAAKGLVKGTVEGVKESVKDALPFKKKKEGTAAPRTDDTQNGGEPEPDKPGE